MLYQDKIEELVESGVGFDDLSFEQLQEVTMLRLDSYAYKDQREVLCESIYNSVQDLAEYLVQGKREAFVNLLVDGMIDYLDRSIRHDMEDEEHKQGIDKLYGTRK